MMIYALMVVCLLCTLHALSTESFGAAFVFVGCILILWFAPDAKVVW